MSERLARYASALLVSVVSTYCGFSRQAIGEPATSPTCSMSDAQAWQLALEDPQEEASPDYILRVTEAFIEQCPGRPEVPSARRIAGMAAGWADLPERAYEHFSEARYIADTDAHFMAMASALHQGDSDTAKDHQDGVFDDWLARLERRGAGTVSVETVEGGDILKVDLSVPGTQGQIEHLWVARPEGLAWPAGLRIETSPTLNAFHQLVAGENARTISHVRLYRCRSRTLLGQSDRPIDPQEMSALARQTLMAYLADPDLSEPGEFDVCLFGDYMLLEPTLRGAIATQ